MHFDTGPFQKSDQSIRVCQKLSIPPITPNIPLKKFQNSEHADKPWILSAVLLYKNRRGLLRKRRSSVSMGPRPCADLSPFQNAFRLI